MFRGVLIFLLLAHLGYRILPPLRPSSVSFSENSIISVFYKIRRPTTALLNFKGNNFALLSAFLILSGDVEQNPGPKTKSIYPCGICEQEVTWNCKGICCDSCDIWFHHSCCGINSYEYLLIGRQNTQWKCPRCDSINVDSFTYNSFELSCYNTYSPLAYAENRSVVDSLSSEPFSPKHTSSPQPNTQCSSPTNRNNTRHRSSRSRHSSANHTSHSNDSSVFSLPKKSNLRILNVNCQKLIGKHGELEAALQYIKPDIVFGTESWLHGIKPGKPPAQGSVGSQEIFPSDYNVFRNDRNQCGGGVFILTHKNLVVEEQPDLCTNCEIEWVRIKLLNRKDLYAGVFYMPHRNLPDTEELKRSLSKLTCEGAKDRDILLAGDFNCPSIDWNDCTVNSKADDAKVQHAILDITSESALTQIHHEPTRLMNILDLVFTSNPTLSKSSRTVPGISDHDMVVSDFDVKPFETKESPRKSFKFSKANWDNINLDINKLGNELENLYLTGSTTEVLWDTFKSAILSTVDKNVPSSTARKRSKLPWIDRNLHKLLKRKKKYYCGAKASNNWAPYTLSKTL